MVKFKSGDKVIRIMGSHMGMKVGDIATVKVYEGSYCMKLYEYDGGHEPVKFKLFSITNWKDEVENGNRIS